MHYPAIQEALPDLTPQRQHRLAGPFRQLRQRGSTPTAFDCIQPLRRQGDDVTMPEADRAEFPAALCGINHILSALPEYRDERKDVNE